MCSRPSFVRSAFHRHITVSGERFSPRVFFFAVLAVTFLVHASYLANGFVWLDHGDIESGRAIVPLPKIYTALFTRFGETGFYRPVVTAVYSLDAAIYDGWAPGYHLTNIALHLAVTAAAALFAGTFFCLTRREQWFVALIVGVHPLSWLTVGAISYRPELLVTLFTLLAVSFHIKAEGTGRQLYVLLALGSTALGVFSKETAVLWIPALITLWELAHFFGWPVGERRAPPHWSLPLFLGEIAIIGIYLFLRLRAVPETWRFAQIALPPSEALGTRLAAVGKLIVQLVNPLKPGLSDATAIVSAVSIPALLAAITLITVLGVIVRLGLRSPWSRALLFLGVALAPACNFVPLPRFSSPHYGYFAVVGVGMSAVLILRALVHTSPSLQGVTKILIAAWMLTMAGTTFAAGFRFKDDRTLFGPEVKQDSHFLEGHYYLGDAFFLSGDYERAVQEYNAAIAPPPGILAYVDRPALLTNCAGALLAQGRLDEADALLRLAAQQASRDALLQILYNRALIHAKRGNDAQVIALLGGEEGWTRPEPLLLLSRALEHLGRNQEAVAALRRALPLLDANKKQQIENLIRQYE